MSIAEKLTAVSQNQQRVYDAGFAAGQAGGGYDEGYEAGQQAEYDRFWDRFQDYGKRTNYRYGFCGVGWTDDNFKPKYTPIVLTGNVYDISYFSKISYIDENIFDCSGATLIQHFLYSNESDKPVTVIMDIASCMQMKNTFVYSDKLETLELKNVREDCTLNNTFLGCSGIVNFSCTGTIGMNISFANSNQLSDESIQNIIDHLKDLTGQTAQTLTLHATVGAKLNEAQKATITARNWALVY